MSEKHCKMKYLIIRYQVSEITISINYLGNH